MEYATGKIYSEEDLKKIFAAASLGEAILKAAMIGKKLVAVSPTAEQLKKRKVGRNDPCPCGSKLKFKKCCLTSSWRNRYGR